MDKHGIELREVFGIAAPGVLARALRRVLGGGGQVTWDRTTLTLLDPALGVATWLGLIGRNRRVPILRYVNRSPPASTAGFCLTAHNALDFRGARSTYDSHRGTDFALCPRTPILAAAPGEVIRVANDLERGGLKVLLDHGEGLVTAYHHLSRASVEVGERVGRGDPIAWSGASGLEFLFLFPAVVPHLHLTVLLDGFWVDPFATVGAHEVALWRTGNDPRPCPLAERGEGTGNIVSSRFDAGAVEATASSCRDPELRRRIAATGAGLERFGTVLALSTSFPESFTKRPALFLESHPRRSVLDLPVDCEQFDGVSHPSI